MARLRSICIPIVLSGAMISRPAAAQAGSVSLTHTVSVTVPERVRVKVANSESAARETGVHPSNGLALSINATQAWSLSIDAPRHAKLQWAREGETRVLGVGGEQHGIASGTSSRVSGATTILVRSTSQDSKGSTALDSDTTSAVLLTVVAQ